MKRAFIIILSLLYIASATGATVHIHYCMGKMISLSLSHTEEDVCGKCGMKKDTRKKGCCKDEYKTFKTNDHRLAKGAQGILHAAVAAILHSADYSSSESVTTSRVAISAPLQAPPSHWRKCPLYLLVRSLRI